MGKFLTVLLGIFVAVAGGRIGFRILLLITLGFVAGFAGVSLSKAYFSPLSSLIRTFTSPGNASILSILILGIVPLILVSYFGRKLIVKLQVTESISDVVDSVLGAAFALAVFISIIYVI